MCRTQFSSRETSIISAVIGGGHRGLTATHGGFSPAVIELRRVGGGGAVTDDRELKLKRCGVKLDPTSFLEIFNFSFCDAVDYPRYKSQLESFCKVSDPIRDSLTPEISLGASSLGDKMKNKLNLSTFWSACLQHAVSLGQDEMGDVADLLSSQALKVLNNWFEACGRGNIFFLFSPSCPSTMLQRKLERIHVTSAQGQFQTHGR